MKTVLSAGSNRQHPEKSRNFCITENGIRTEEGVSLALDEEDELEELEDEELELELDELLEDEEEPWEPPAPPPTFGSSPMLTGGSSGGAAAAPFVPNPRSGSWGARFLIMRLSSACSRAMLLWLGASA